MPKEITAYQAADGTLHTNACAAATKDLELLIGQSPLAENQPYARKVLEWLTADPDTIMDKMKEFQIACPKEVTGEAPSKESTGPVAQQAPQREMADGD
jgi:hypothetical protein